MVQYEYFVNSILFKKPSLKGGVTFSYLVFLFLLSVRVFVLLFFIDGMCQTQVRGHLPRFRNARFQQTPI